MLITNVPLELLAANDPHHHYRPCDSSFQGVLKQDMEAKIRELEDWSDVTHRRKYVVVPHNLVYPIIEERLALTEAQVGSIQPLREGTFACKKYMDWYDGKGNFLGLVHPPISLYTVTPITKIPR